MTSAYPRRQASFCDTRISRGVKPYLLALLLGAASLTACAESRWCDWLPFLPKCQGDEPEPLNASAVVNADSADNQLSKLTGFGSNPGALKMFT